MILALLFAFAESLGFDAARGLACGTAQGRAHHHVA
jgi:hypothetical protein